MQYHWLAVTVDELGDLMGALSAAQEDITYRATELRGIDYTDEDCVDMLDTADAYGVLFERVAKAADRAAREEAKR